MPLNFAPADLAAAPAVEITAIVPTENDPHHYLKIYFPTPADAAVRAELALLDDLTPAVLRLPRSRDLENRDGLFYQLAPDCNAGAIANEVARCLSADCQLNVRCYSANAQRRWLQDFPWPAAGNPEPPVAGAAALATGREALMLQTLERLERRLIAIELRLACQHLDAVGLARYLLDLLEQDPWPEAEIQALAVEIDRYQPQTDADAINAQQLRSLVATAGEALVAELTAFLQEDREVPLP